MDIFDNEIAKINIDVTHYIYKEVERHLAAQLKEWGTLDYAKELVELKQKLKSQLEYIHALEGQLAKMDASNRPG